MLVIGIEENDERADRLLQRGKMKVPDYRLDKPPVAAAIDSPADRLLGRPAECFRRRFIQHRSNIIAWRLRLDFVVERDDPRGDFFRRPYDEEPMPRIKNTLQDEDQQT